MFKRRLLLLTFFIGTALLAVCKMSQGEAQQKKSRLGPPGGDVNSYAPTVVIPRAFPPIMDPKSVSAAEANLTPNELVLGVTVDGESRAYPINQLQGPTREIINDELGGTAIAATW